MSASRSSAATAGKRWSRPSATRRSCSCRHVRWLLEDRADDRGHHRGRGSGHQSLGVAGEVDPAALPGRSEQQLVDGSHETAVGIADHQAHTGQAALDQAAQERSPGVALIVAGGKLESEHAALASGGDADRDQSRHGDDPATVADLDVGGVEPQVWVELAGERTRSEGLDLGVERGAHPADLALRERSHAQGGDEVLDPASADSGHVGFAYDCEQRSLGTSARLQKRWEVAAVTDLGDGEIDRADTGVPAAFSISVAVGQAPLGCPLALGHSGELGHLGLHQRGREHSHAFTQEVDIAVRTQLAQHLEHGHSVFGHRGVPFVVGF